MSMECEKAISHVVEEHYPDDFERGIVAVFEVLMGMLSAHSPSNEALKKFLVFAADEWIEKRGAEADKHFADIRPKVN